jgi:glycosyltransferase involved in cell wall biosynthesis
VVPPAGAPRPRRLLILSYEHPPNPGAGGNRWTSIARYLREWGYPVTVVASRAWGSLPTDAELGVVRVPDLRASSVLRRVLRRGRLRTAGDKDLLERPPTALLTKVVVPDMNVVTALPALAATVRRLLAQQDYDCIVTTSPPESTHLVGLLVGSRRPAWIADFRDGWCYEPWREPFPTSLQRKADAWLERRVAQAADIAVGATLPIAEDLEKRLVSRAAYIPNGWDPAAVPQVQSAIASDGVRLVYTGTLSIVRDPRPLFRALHIVRQESGGEHLRLVHAGRLTTTERRLIEACGVEDAVEHLGTLDRAHAVALQRSADALVLVTSRSASEATSKIFEYIAAGRPIVALAENNEASRIVRETNTGVTVPPDDVDAIAAALRRVLSGDLQRDFRPRDLDRYIYPAPAERMAELIEEAIRLRRDAKGSASTDG